MSIQIPRLAGLKQRPTKRAAPAVPAWVADHFGLHASDSAKDIVTGRGASLVSVIVPRAAAMSASEFEQATRTAYEQIAGQLNPLQARFPIRFWNHIPAIHRREADGRDRYMIFNAGRFSAFESWYGAPNAFDHTIPTASGVGTDGDDLMIHCLAADQPGRAVANPRQLQSFHYSDKYGPLPPCFARATVVADRLILVGGTASIRGEETLFEGDLGQQIDETFANLTAVMRQATGDATDDVARGRYRDMRVYLPDIAHASHVEKRLRETFPNAASVELVQADLCRPPLMVEIEGIGEIVA